MRYTLRKEESESDNNNNNLVQEHDHRTIQNTENANKYFTAKGSVVGLFSFSERDEIDRYSLFDTNQRSIQY